MTEETKNNDPLQDLFDGIISDDLTEQFQKLCDKFVGLCDQKDLVTQIDMIDLNEDEPNFIYFGDEDEDVHFVVSVNVFSETVQTNECQLSFGGFENDIKKKIIAQMQKIFVSLTETPEQTFYVDIPQKNKEEWTNVETFTSREAAIAFAQEKFGADEKGMVSLISVS